MVNAIDRAGNEEQKEPRVELTYNDGNISVAVESVNADSLKGDDVLFDLQGRRIFKRPKQGIYIRSGRKILITK